MSDAAFFREGLAAGELHIRICSSCGRGAYPPMPTCPHCGGEHGEVTRASGAGALYSWTVCHVPFDPAFADDVPYAVGLVELPEGVRVIARVGGEPASLAPDMALHATFPVGPDGSVVLTFEPDDVTDVTDEGARDDDE